MIMKITNVSIDLIATEGQAVKAYANVLIDNCFVIKNIRVIKRDKGYLIAMPSKKNEIGTYVDLAHPINVETRKMFEENVLNKFFEEVSKQLKSIKVSKVYELRFNMENVNSVALIEDYKTETLQELEEEIDEFFEKIN